MRVAYEIKECVHVNLTADTVQGASIEELILHLGQEMHSKILQLTQTTGRVKPTGVGLSALLHIAEHGRGR